MDYVMHSKPHAKKTRIKKEKLNSTQPNSIFQQALQSALIQCQQDLLNTAHLASVVVQIKDMQKKSTLLFSQYRSIRRIPARSRFKNKARSVYL